MWAISERIVGCGGLRGTVPAPKLGQALGGRDHATVMHGIGKVERGLATDTALRGQVMAIREALFAAGG
jgi:hypothetical protein